MAKGHFITLEGGEGVGKSTNLAFLVEYLKSKHIKFEVTREPGGTPLSEDIRNLVLNPRDEEVDDTCELLMVFAARAQHLNTFILPRLKKGVWVISDRFTDATYAYQGRGRGIDLKAILDLEIMVQGSVQPDLTIYLDCPPEIGMHRVGERAELDRIESAGMAFMHRVRQGYLERIEQFPNRFVKVDASVDLESVQAQIAREVDRYMDQH